MPSTSFLFPTEHKFPSYEISFLPAALSDIMPLIFQREERIKIMRHSVSILKFSYLIGKTPPHSKKKERKEGRKAKIQQKRCNHPQVPGPKELNGTIRRILYLGTNFRHFRFFSSLLIKVKMGNSEISSLAETEHESPVRREDAQWLPGSLCCSAVMKSPLIYLPSPTVNYFSIYLVDLQVEGNLLPGNCLTSMLSRRHSDPVRLTAAWVDFYLIATLN